MVTRQVRQTHIFASGFERGELMKAIAVRAEDCSRMPASAWRCLCLASTRRGPSATWSPIFAPLPEAMIYVYDNNSADRTVDVARAAGALVRRERHQGKGNVVRRMFA